MTLFPGLFLHWEDFGRDHAHLLLDRYQKQLCSFNDDIQGTGAVTVAALLSALHDQRTKLSAQRIVIYGAGSAGTGIAERLLAFMRHEGSGRDEALQKFWLVDKDGVLTNQHDTLTPAQQPFARQDAVHYPANMSLEKLIETVQPTVLIGCSGCPNGFTEGGIRAMSAHTTQPIIFPLSNPNTLAEATPTQLLHWSDGRAHIATGSPFDPITWEGKTRSIAQCNNALIYPGIGLGALASQASEITDRMLAMACQSLADLSAQWRREGYIDGLLPPLSLTPQVSKHVAFAVAKAAINEGIGTLNVDNDEALRHHIERQVWHADYLPYSYQGS